MKKFSKYAAQGDFLIIKVGEFPSDLENFEAEGMNYIIAHSETGHNHVMERTSVKAYKPKGVSAEDLYSLYLEVQKPTKIEHMRSFDTHETLLVEPGKYLVRRQREYTPEGYRRAAD